MSTQADHPLLELVAVGGRIRRGMVRRALPAETLRALKRKVRKS